MLSNSRLVSVKGLLIILISAFGVASSNFASSIVTPASAAMNVLGCALEFYEKKHGGQLPASLVVLDPYLIDSVVRQLGGGSIDDAVMLVTGANVQMVTPNKNEIFKGGTILAVTARPIDEEGRPSLGRYVIWKTSEGRFRTSWLLEKIVAAQFANAGLKLRSGEVLKQPRTLGSSVPIFAGTVVVAIIVWAWIYLVKPGTSGINQKAKTDS
jgi:hypothetical protein